jgi:hypothetical protein
VQWYRDKEEITERWMGTHQALLLCVSNSYQKYTIEQRSGLRSMGLSTPKLFRTISNYKVGCEMKFELSTDCGDYVLHTAVTGGSCLRNLGSLSDPVTRLSNQKTKMSKKVEKRMEPVMAETGRYLTLYRNNCIKPKSAKIASV